MNGRFDDKADAWDAYTQSPGGRLRRELILRNLAAYRPAFEGMRVLDAAGGVGDTALELARQGCRVTLLDVSAEMLEMAQARALAGGLDTLTFVCADVTAVDTLFPAASFDLVLAHSVLAFLPDPTETLTSLVRLLASGGALSLVFGNRYHFPLRYALAERDADRALEALTADDFAAGTDLFGQVRRVFDPAVVQGMVAQVGLQVVRVFGLRVLVDLVPSGFSDPSKWLALEVAAGSHPALWSIARFVQIIAVI